MKWVGEGVEGLIIRLNFFPSVTKQPVIGSQKSYATFLLSITIDTEEDLFKVWSLPVSLHISVAVCLCLCLFVCLSACMSVHLCLSISLCLSLSVSLSLRLPDGSLRLPHGTVEEISLCWGRHAVRSVLLAFTVNPGPEVYGSAYTLR